MSRLIYTNNGNKNSFKIEETSPTTARLKLGKESHLGQPFDGEMISGSILTFTIQNRNPERPLKCSIANPINLVEDDLFYYFDIDSIEIDTAIISKINDLNNFIVVYLFCSSGAASSAATVTHLLGAGQDNVDNGVDTLGAGESGHVLTWNNGAGQWEAQSATSQDHFVGFKYQYNSTFAGDPASGFFKVDTGTNVIKISKTDSLGGVVTSSYFTESGWQCMWEFFSTDNKHLHYRVRRRGSQNGVSDTLVDSGTFYTLTVSQAIILPPFANLENVLFHINDSVMKILSNITDVETGDPPLRDCASLVYDLTGIDVWTNRTPSEIGYAYSFDSVVSGVPLLSDFTFNNADPALATSMNINKTDDNRDNPNLGWLNTAINFKLIGTCHRDDEHEYTIAPPAVDNTTYWTVPIVNVSTSGALTNNRGYHFVTVATPTEDTAAGEQYTYLATSGLPTADGEFTITTGDTLNIRKNNLDGTAGYINGINPTAPRADNAWLKFYHQTSHGDYIIVVLNESTNITDNGLYYTMTPCDITTIGATAPPWDSYFHFVPHKSLEQLVDVVIGDIALADGQHLEYEASSQLWKNKPSAGTLVGLSDTCIPEVTYNDLDTYQTPQNRWRSDTLVGATTWTDSINSRTPQVSTGVPNPPVSIGTNARNAVNIDTTTDIYELQIEPLTDVYTIILVLEDVIPNAGNQGHYFQIRSTAGVQTALMITPTVGTQNSLNSIHNDGVNGSIYSIPDPDFPVQSGSVGTTLVMTLTSDGTTSSAYINGIQKRSAGQSLALTNLNRLRVLGQATNLRGSRGQIGEIIVYNTSLSSTQIGTVTNSLLEYFNSQGQRDGHFLRYNGVCWANNAITSADIADLPVDTNITGFCMVGSPAVSQGAGRVNITGTTISLSYELTTATPIGDWITQSPIDTRVGSLICIKREGVEEDQYIAQVVAGTTSTTTDFVANDTRVYAINNLEWRYLPTAFTTLVDFDTYHVSQLWQGEAVAQALNDITDVTLTAPSTNQYLCKSAGNWVNGTVDYSHLSGTPTIPAVDRTGHTFKLDTSGVPSLADGSFRLNGTDLQINKLNAEGVAIPAPAGVERYSFYHRLITFSGRALIVITSNTSVVTDNTQWWNISNVNALQNNLTNGDDCRLVIGSHVEALNMLGDVSLATINTGNALFYNGTNWVNRASNQGQIKINTGNGLQPTYVGLTTAQAITYASPLGISGFPTSSPPLAINNGVFADADIYDFVNNRFLEQQLASATHGGQIHIWRFILDYSNKTVSNSGVCTIILNNALSGFTAKASFPLPQGLAAETDRYSELITIADDASKLPLVGGVGQGYDLTIESTTSIDVTITSITRIALEYCQRA